MKKLITITLIAGFVLACFMPWWIQHNNNMMGINPTPPNGHCIYLGGETCTINATPDVSWQQMQECALYCVNSHSATYNKTPLQ